MMTEEFAINMMEQIQILKKKKKAIEHKHS